MNVMYVFIAAETAEGGRMMSVDEKAREMARQYIPHEGGFSMGGLLQNIIEYFEADVAQLRADRNAAQQRAEQAERERDEARAVIDRAIEILGSPFGLGEEDDTAQLLSEHKRVSDLLTAFQKRYTATSSPHWTPQTGAEIAAAMGDTPILPADFDIDRAPTVKAAPLWRSMTHLVGVGEIAYDDTMSMIGHRLRIAHDCINQTETETDAALEQMHHALVLMYHALDLKGGAK